MIIFFCYDLAIVKVLFEMWLHKVRAWYYTPNDQQNRNQPKKKGVDMEVKDYCKAMMAEVSAWKAKLEAMKKTADGFGSEQKEKVLPLIGQLEQEVVNAQLRVNQLENECPSDWSPIKNELEELFGTVGSKLDRAFQEVSSREVLW